MRDFHGFQDFPQIGRFETVAMGVTWNFSPSIFEIDFTAAFTSLLTLVPDPIGWMLNSAMVTMDFRGKIHS